MAWTFSGAFLDGMAADRVTVGAGEPRELPGRYALAGLVDAHAHPTVAAGGRGPCLAGRRARRRAPGRVRGRRGHRDPRRRGPQQGHARLRARRGGRAPGGDRRRPLPGPGGPVLPPHALPGRAGRARRGRRAEVAAGAAWVKIIGDFPEWGDDGPVPQSTAATYDLGTLRAAVDAAHAAGARVAVHSNLPDSGLVAIGADSIEHGTGARARGARRARRPRRRLDADAVRRAGEPRLRRSRGARAGRRAARAPARLPPVRRLPRRAGAGGHRRRRDDRRTRSRCWPVTA